MKDAAPPDEPAPAAAIETLVGNHREFLKFGCLDCSCEAKHGAGGEEPRRG